MDTSEVCPDEGGAPRVQDVLTFRELFQALTPSSAAANSSTANAEVHLRRQFESLGETLLIRPVGYPNKTVCPLEFLTSHEAVAWEVPGVQVPRIGCKNYWVVGRAGGSSEWTEDDDDL